MDKVIPFFKSEGLDLSESTETEMIVKIIDNELKRIDFRLSTFKVLNSETSRLFYNNAKLIFKELKNIFRKTDDIDITIGNLKFKQVEYLISAFQIQADYMENNSIQISLQMQDTYLKLVAIHTEKAIKEKCNLSENYYMVLTK